jgi:hypothetical protein
VCGTHLPGTVLATCELHVCVHSYSSMVTGYKKKQKYIPGYTPGTAVLRTVIYIHIIHTDGTMVPCELHLSNYSEALRILVPPHKLHRNGHR